MNQKRTVISLIIILILALGIGAGVYLTQFTQVFKPRASFSPQINRMMDAEATMPHDDPNAASYGYAPSIIKKDGVYYGFYCSTPYDEGARTPNRPFGVDGSVDYIRLIKSPVGDANGTGWLLPSIVLKTKASVKNGMLTNIAACDPSVVYYNGFYYLFFTNVEQTGGSIANGAMNPLPGQGGPLAQNYIAVARSASIEGPYLTLTENNTWESNPPTAKAIIKPQNLRTNTIQGAAGLGASWESVVVRNGKLQMWYTDDSDGNMATAKTYMIESTDPTNWNISTRRQINLIGLHSPEVKFNPQTNSYILASVRGSNSADSSLELASSADGITWNAVTLLAAGVLPRFSHNIGFSSDQSGNLVNGEDVVFGFGAPHNLCYSGCADTSGHWDMWSFKVPLSQLPSASTAPVAPPSVPTASQYPIPTQPPTGVARSAINHFYLELPGGGVHYYSWNDSPAGWTNYGPVFWAYSSQQPGTVAINHYYFEAPGGGRHLYQAGSGPAGWTDYGVAFYAYPNKGTPGTVGINHFYYEAPGGGVHYYSWNDSPAGWTNYGPAFWAFPDSGVVNGGYSDWNACSASCGGGNRIRFCNNPAPANGGADCSGLGPTSEICSPNSCQAPPINAVWGPWSECSVTCGEGTQTRSCTEAQNGGIPCSQTDGGNAVRACTMPACSVPPSPSLSPSPSGSPQPVASFPGSSKVADLNKDGVIDILDFNIFVQDLASGNLRSDFNGNNQVDIFDFNILVKNFGRSASDPVRF